MTYNQKEHEKPHNLYPHEQLLSWLPTIQIPYKIIFGIVGMISTIVFTAIATMIPLAAAHGMLETPFQDFFISCVILGVSALVTQICLFEEERK